jgi:hypothetical protein
MLGYIINLFYLYYIVYMKYESSNYERNVSTLIRNEKNCNFLVLKFVCLCINLNDYWYN